MTRFRYCKQGEAVWISHLDMMRMFQRAFRRAGIAIRRTNGFNPHAHVSIALPLPVGMSSRCELLDCALEDDSISPQEAMERLNHAGFPEGIRILEAYEAQRKIRELRRLQVELRLEYDRGVPGGAQERISQLLQQPSLVVEKRSKRGPVETDIRPLLLSSDVRLQDAGTLRIEAEVCAGEPSLNPELLLRAIARYAPADAPDFSRICRLETLDENGATFR